jgi:hypothetical protein
MRITRTTVTAHIQKSKAKIINDWQAVTFSALKKLLKPYEENLNVISNAANHYELWTNLGYRSKSFHVKRNKGIAFAAVIIFDKYIGFYFYPLNVSAALRERIQEPLRNSKTGVYTFHFREGDDANINDLRDLVKEGWNVYKEQRLVRD